MKARIDSPCYGRLAVCCLVLFALAASAHAAPDSAGSPVEPTVYLNMNEGSGQYLVDFSGNGNSGTIHDVTRIQTGACGNALFFNGIDSYVAIPYRSNNHPLTAITIDFWFSVDSYDRQVLVSTYNEGGYRIAFDDGNDLWWTVRTTRGDVSVPLQHESIPLHRWHHFAGTYDGVQSRLYLDGILRNTGNGTGPILYTYANDLMLGVDAGTGDQPDPQCNGYFHGGLDELRVYDRVLTYGQVMDDRFSCPQEPRVPEFSPSNRTLPADCDGSAEPLTLSGSEPLTRRLIFTSPDQYDSVNVRMPPGSTLYVGIRDAYPESYPESWYFEINEDGNRLTRSIAFPNTYNTPAEMVVPSGNATITVKYFDGAKRFPSSAFIVVRAVAPPAPVVQPTPVPIFSNPIIVIYTASWATLIAVILVFFWLHSRRKKKPE